MSAIEKNGTGLKASHQNYMANWKASGRPVALVTCPHCQQDHETTAIPETDTMMVCPRCDELFYKVVDAGGVAHAALPGRIIDTLVSGGAA